DLFSDMVLEEEVVAGKEVMFDLTTNHISLF
ncbi:MAG: hypothetical protein ACI85I_002462, partial [Arenicella sp.]